MVAANGRALNNMSTSVPAPDGRFASIVPTLPIVIAPPVDLTRGMGCIASFCYARPLTKFAVARRLYGCAGTGRFGRKRLTNR
ncbi:hypothetical protein C1J03_10585 [Sulfitobacter sp. SK012]|nr:hypothetical protein C1J03_10585 [Sulfitobacter sp. SK012]